MCIRDRDDTAGGGGDTGEAPSPYAGTYAGAMTFTCTRIMSTTCRGVLEAVVNRAGQLVGEEADCVAQEFGGVDLIVESFGGVIDAADRVVGVMRLEGRSLEWDGRVLSSGDDRFITGTGSGTVEVDGVTYDCEMELSLDD